MKSSSIASNRFGVLFVAALSLLSISQAKAQILWYNGDRNHVASLFATDSTAGTDYSGFVYDDFTVTSTNGWQVNGVFGNFLLPNPVSNANWEIRSNVSAGYGGTLVDSGSGPVVATPVGGPNGSGNTQYTIAVTGLSFDLAPGTYWLGLQPISTGDGYLVTTYGANAVGTPAGNDGNAYYTETTLGGNTYEGKYFESTTSEGSNLGDFSLGVTGAVVPEPSSWMLALLSIAWVASLRARSRLGRV